MATILEALESAAFNLRSPLGIAIARDQIENSLCLLEKGYSVYTDIEEMAAKFGGLEHAPEVE